MKINQLKYLPFDILPKTFQRYISKRNRLNQILTLSNLSRAERLEIKKYRFKYQINSITIKEHLKQQPCGCTLCKLQHRLETFKSEKKRLQKIYNNISTISEIASRFPGEIAKPFSRASLAMSLVSDNLNNNLPIIIGVEVFKKIKYKKISTPNNVKFPPTEAVTSTDSNGKVHIETIPTKVYYLRDNNLFLSGRQADLISSSLTSIELKIEQLKLAIKTLKKRIYLW